MRERRISFSPLLPVVKVSILISRQLNKQHVFIFTRQRLSAPVNEDLTRINWPRRCANHNHQAVISRVRRWHHIFHGLLGEDLSLIEHDHIDHRETTTEPSFTSTKKNPGPVGELNFLLTISFSDVLDERRNSFPVRHRIHRLERFVMRPRSMSRPQHKKTRACHTQREDQRTDRISLPRLAWNGSYRATHAARILTILTLRQNRLTQPRLPTIQRKLHALQLRSNTRPRSRNNPRRHNQMPSNLR